MKRLLERLQPLKAAVKSIFFISITVLVVIELVRLKRTITLESLESALAGLSIWHLVLMAVIGLTIRVRSSASQALRTSVAAC